MGVTLHSQKVKRISSSNTGDEPKVAEVMHQVSNYGSGEMSNTPQKASLECTPRYRYTPTCTVRMVLPPMRARLLRQEIFLSPEKCRMQN